MQYIDFEAISINQKDAKCSECKRMHCTLRQVFEQALCKDCFQKQILTNPEKFAKKKQENISEVLPAELKKVSKSTTKKRQEPIIEKNITNNKVEELKISLPLLFGLVAFGIVATSAIILAIVFGLQIGGITI